MSIVISGKREEALLIHETSQRISAFESSFIEMDTDPSVLTDENLKGKEICLIASPTRLPSLMDTMTARALFERVKNKGITTVMTAKRPEGEEPNWMMYTGMVLPYVDVLYADYDDALWLFDKENYENYHGKYDPEICSQISLSLINMGCAAVVFFLGKEGYYLRTSSVRPRYESMGPCSPQDIDAWWARELYSPRYESDQFCFLNSTVGLLAGLDNRLLPEDLLNGMAAVGCSCGESTWENIDMRVLSGWNKFLPFEPYSSWPEGERTVRTGPDEKVEA